MTAERIVMEEPEWIPVKDRLPDHNCRVWVTTELGTVISCSFATSLYKVDKYTFPDMKGKAGFYDFDGDIGFYEWFGIKAWMPYYEPEPYKEAKNDKRT